MMAEISFLHSPDPFPAIDVDLDLLDLFPSFDSNPVTEDALHAAAIQPPDQNSDSDSGLECTTNGNSMSSPSDVFGSMVSSVLSTGDDMLAQPFPPSNSSETSSSSASLAPAPDPALCGAQTAPMVGTLRPMVLASPAAPPPRSARPFARPTAPPPITLPAGGGVPKTATLVPLYAFDPTGGGGGSPRSLTSLPGTPLASTADFIELPVISSDVAHWAHASPEAEADEKEMVLREKKKLRMIRNRHAAHLSRLRKKERISELEAQVEKLTEQKAIAEDTVQRLFRENEALKAECLRLQSRPDTCLSCRDRFAEIAASPGRRRRLPASKMAVASLSIFCIFFLLNVQPFFGLWSSPQMLGVRQRARDTPAALPSLNFPQSGSFMRHSGRTLLNAGSTRVRFGPEREPTAAAAQSRPVAPAGSEVNGTAGGGANCNEVPGYYNATHAARLENELNGWMRQYKAEQRTATASAATEAGRRRRWRRTSERADQKAREQHRRFPPVNVDELRMKRFLSLLPRREDTMYFVSLQGEQLVLPATPAANGNDTDVRFRMAFLMPVAFGLNETMRPAKNQVAMMQINCQLLNYSVFHVEKRLLPSFAAGPLGSARFGPAWNKGSREWYGGNL